MKTTSEPGVPTKTNQKARKQGEGGSRKRTRGFGKQSACLGAMGEGHYREDWGGSFCSWRNPFKTPPSTHTHTYMLSLAIAPVH